MPPIFTTLKAYCPPFTVFLWPRDGGELGCEGPFISACSFNFELCFMGAFCILWVGDKPVDIIMTSSSLVSVSIVFFLFFFKQTPPTPEEMGHCDSVYLSEVGDTQVVVFKHGKKNVTLFLLAIHNVCIYVYVCIYIYIHTCIHIHTPLFKNVN